LRNPRKLRPIQYVDLQNYPAGLPKLLSAFPEALFSKTRSVKSILNDLKSADPQIRISALNLIGFGQLREALTETIRALNDTDYHVRSGAAYALDKLNDPAAIPALLEAMHDASFDVRSSAGWALVHLGEQVIPPVVEILRDDPDRSARHMAYEVLLRIGSTEAMAAIKRYWK
jgi:HEAT repeat protein